MFQAALIYLAVLLSMSIVTTLIYWWDKRRAEAGTGRVPEKTLHLLAFLGGWPGAWWAQRQLRHKTRKLQFQVVFWVLVTIHLGVVCVIAWFLYTRPDLAS
ncbi:MAG: DUF1294 domain-containing protein [Fimbriiglobus sp.]|nr:DUF1294 domain-containing protein [Fimbriiglobus sp.]